MRRKAINIVLDLDNTLIYSHNFSKIKKDNPDWLSNYSYENMDDDYVVCERPGLQVFLDWLFKHFNENLKCHSFKKEIYKASEAKRTSFCYFKLPIFIAHK